MALNKLQAAQLYNDAQSVHPDLDRALQYMAKRQAQAATSAASQQDEPALKDKLRLALEETLQR